MEQVLNLVEPNESACGPAGFNKTCVGSRPERR